LLPWQICLPQAASETKQTLIVVATQVVIDDDIVKLVFGSFLPPQNADRTLEPLHPWEMALMSIFLFCKAFPSLSIEVP
jgi:hypothetical protein